MTSLHLSCLERHLATGRSNRDVADAHCLIERTVENRVLQTPTKLDLPSRTAAAAYVGTGVHRFVWWCGLRRRRPGCRSRLSRQRGHQPAGKAVDA